MAGQELLAGMALVRLKLLEHVPDCLGNSARQGLIGNDMRMCALIDCVKTGWTRGAGQTDSLWRRRMSGMSFGSGDE